MPTSYTYARQGNGVDSWIAVETDDTGEVTSKYMVYEDPNKKATIREFEKLSTEDIASFKSIIGVTGGGGGSVTLTSGEGIDVVDNGNGSYTINSTGGGGSVKLMADKGIIISEIDGGYSIGVDFKAFAERGIIGERYTGVVPVFDGKSTNFLDFRYGLLVSVKGDGANEMPSEG
jgi:hypothetical protein